MGIFDSIFPSSIPPAVKSTEVPKDAKSLSIAPTDSLTSAYAGAGINRADIIAKAATDKAAADKTAADKAIVLKKQDNQQYLSDQINKGLQQGNDNWVKYKDLSKVPDLGYVTAAQAKLYIGGILVDECYDVQYQYKEYKEPVYGYNDKHWGAVLKGNTIVSGTFTINYKHDAYLLKLLAKVNEANKGAAGSPKDRIANDWKRKEELERQSKEFKAKLKEYKTAFSNLNLLKTDAKVLALEVKTADEEMKMYNEAGGGVDTVISKDFDAKNANLTKSKNDFLQSLSPEDREKVIKGEASFISATEDYQDQLKSNKDDLTALSNEINTIKAQKDKKFAEVSTLEIALQALKSTPTAPDIASKISEKESALQSLLADIAQLNTTITEKTAWMNDMQKQHKVFLEESTQDVNNTLDDNDTKAYAKLGLQQAKLKASKDAAIAEAKKTKDKIKARQESAKARLEMYTKAITESEKALKDMLNGSGDTLGITGLRAKVNELNDSISKAASNPDYALKNSGTRAEDYGTWEGSTFNIFIEYNGVTHKILQQCTLTGHGHVVAQGGEVIKEYYTFICRMIK